MLVSHCTALLTLLDMYTGYIGRAFGEKIYEKNFPEVGVSITSHLVPVASCHFFLYILFFLR